VNLSDYLATALTHVVYEETYDGRYFAAIPGLGGLWAKGISEDDAREQLKDALPGWLYEHTAKMR
jgi:predicted RNase H-like HicB family nuclease